MNFARKKIFSLFFSTANVSPKNPFCAKVLSGLQKLTHLVVITGEDEKMLTLLLASQNSCTPFNISFPDVSTQLLEYETPTASVSFKDIGISGERKTQFKVTLKG